MLKYLSMRYFGTALLLLICTLPSLAADALAGTWKLNTARTRFKTGIPPTTIRVIDVGDTVEVDVTGTNRDGSQFRNHYIAPAAGGPGRILQSSYESVTWTWVSDRVREAHYLKSGNRFVARSEVSADGKTLTLTVHGKNAVGQLAEGTAVYHRQ